MYEQIEEATPGGLGELCKRLEEQLEQAESGIRQGESHLAQLRQQIAGHGLSIEHQLARCSDLEDEIARHRRQLAALNIHAGDLAQQFRKTADDLAFGLSHVTHLFHPEVIVLGGGLSLVGEPLREAIERHLRRFTMEAFAPGPQVRLAALGEDAVPAGALLLAGDMVEN